MKKEDYRSIARHKFKTYKTGFAVFFAFYLISFILGSTLFAKGHLSFASPVLSRVLASYDTGFSGAVRVLLLTLLPTFLVFVSGITVYAPIACALSMISSGMFSGAACSFFISKSRIMLGLFEIIFSSVAGYASIIYSTVVTLVAMRIFTDVPKDSELFTGTLFTPSGFRGVFNYRFALSYIAFYIIFALFLSLVIIIRSLLASLV